MWPDISRVVEDPAPHPPPSRRPFKGGHCKQALGRRHHRDPLRPRPSHHWLNGDGYCLSTQTAFGIPSLPARRAPLACLTKKRCTIAAQRRPRQAQGPSSADIATRPNASSPRPRIAPAQAAQSVRPPESLNTGLSPQTGGRVRRIVATDGGSHRWARNAFSQGGRLIAGTARGRATGRPRRFQPRLVSVHHTCSMYYSGRSPEGAPTATLRSAVRAR
jgi:hypothetical protein